MYLFCPLSILVAFSQRSGPSSLVSSGAASQAAMVDAFVAANTKGSWKGMAAGGGGGGVISRVSEGGTKRLPPSRYLLLKPAQQGGKRTSP